MTVDSFRFLQQWYADQCNGDWEHEFGIRLETVDNPGWLLRVDLVDTDLEGRTRELSTEEQTGNRWMSTKSDGEKYQSACDPLSLDDVLARFRDFAEGRASD